MPEKHELSFEEFDLRVAVDNEGDVSVSFHTLGKCVLDMTWDDLREVIEFVGIHGLKMNFPMFVEFAATMEAQQELASA